MEDLDDVIHQPTRLRMLMLLSGVAEADFKFIMKTLELSNGNLSVHSSKLEQAGYIEIEKGFKDKMQHTTYRITGLGKEKLAKYWETLDSIRTGK